MKKLILTLAIIVLLAGCVSTDKARDVISNMQDKFNEMKDYECYYKVITETNETKKSKAIIWFSKNQISS